MILYILQVVDVTIEVLCHMIYDQKHGAPAVSKTLHCGGGKQVLFAKKLNLIMVSLKNLSSFHVHNYFRLQVCLSFCPNWPSYPSVPSNAVIPQKLTKKFLGVCYEKKNSLLVILKCLRSMRPSLDKLCKLQCFITSQILVPISCVLVKKV